MTHVRTFILGGRRFGNGREQEGGSDLEHQHRRLGSGNELSYRCGTSLHADGRERCCDRAQRLRRWIAQGQSQEADLHPVVLDEVKGFRPPGLLFQGWTGRTGAVTGFGLN